MGRKYWAGQDCVAVPRVEYGEALWNLLLETGFLYRDKLEDLKSDLLAIKATFTDLLDASSIAHSLLHERGSNAEGCLSALRLYRRTWLIHHLACHKHSLYSALLLNCEMAEYFLKRDDFDWVRLYFRPNNRWPARVFGGFSRQVCDAMWCRATTYQYLKGPTLEAPPCAGIQVSATRQYAAVARFLAEIVDGVDREMADLTPDELGLGTVSAAFAAEGFLRRREIIVAEREDEILGCALLEISTLGLNLSELTNVFRLYARPNHELAGEVAAALIAAAQSRYHALGRQRCFALVSGEATAFLERGFTAEREYVAWSLHRSKIPQFRSYLTKLYGREPENAVGQGR